MTAVTIRTYRDSDLDSCRLLWAELTEVHRDLYQDPGIGGEEPGQFFDQHLSRVGPECIWIAEVGGAIAGLTGLIVEEGGAEAEVEPVIVAAAYRDHGVGQALVGRAVEEARHLGMRYLNVRPVARNVKAVSFYFRCGFHTLGQLEMFIDLTREESRPWKPGPELFGHRFDF